MRSRLERTKPLDANVEKDGAEEINWDSYDYLWDDLETDDERNARVESEAIARLVLESEMSDEEEALWDKNDLGKYTIGVPTNAKKAVENQENRMEPVSEIEFTEILSDVDPEDKKMQAKLEEAVQELEGIF